MCLQLGKGHFCDLRVWNKITHKYFWLKKMEPESISFLMVHAQHAGNLNIF